ncbi:MAG: HAD family hydrolase [Bacteroidota bacterium]
MKYNAIIFDLDGTLLNSLEDIADATNRVLAADGFPIHSTEEYRDFVGYGAKELIFRVLPPDYRDAETLQRCLRAYLVDYGRNWNIKTKPYPGIPEMLDLLKVHKFKLAVLSNKPEEFTQVCVRQLLSGWKFDVVLGASKNIPPKPDPAGALEIAKRMQLTADRYLYMGDSGVDMQTATAAHMFPVGVLWGFRGRAELLKEGAKVLLEHPEELSKILD